MSSVADEAIQQKIVIKELHLKKTLVKFFAFRKALLATSPDSNETEVAYEEFLQALDLHEFATEKLQTLTTTLERESQAYVNCCTSKLDEVEKVKKEIQQLVLQLEDERTARNNKEEYMALAKLINQFPQRSEIGISAENSVAALENELTMLDATAASLEQRRALRQRQASVLLNAIADLQKELDDNSDAMS